MSSSRMIWMLSAGLNTDFEKLVNLTGRFAVGGSFADCGITGRKLACDTYGGLARIGGGALSGKDPSKVDRSAAYINSNAMGYVVRRHIEGGSNRRLNSAILPLRPHSHAGNRGLLAA